MWCWEDLPVGEGRGFASYCTLGKQTLRPFYQGEVALCRRRSGRRSGFY